MASGFDPYYKWLGIPSEEQPPNHYRLLGLRLFEGDPEVIEAAWDQRMAHLRTYQTGHYAALSQRLLNEVAGAKVCLLSPERRARYDETLRSTVPAASRLVPLPSAASPPALQDTQVEPMVPPAASGQRFDLSRLGVAEDLDGGSAVRPGSGIGRVSQPRRREPAFSGVAADNPALTAKPRHTLLIAVLATCTVVMCLVTALVYLARVMRTEQPVTSAGSSTSAVRASANPPSIPAGTGPVSARPPALVQPASGARLPNPNPPIGIVLRWQPVVNASRYWVRVELPNSAKPLVDEHGLDHASLHITLNRPVPRENCHGWRWQVLAMVNGQWTDWSETRTFDLAQPAN